jgi:GxxExxY protein
MDLLVEEQLVIEIKSVSELTPLFDAQVLTYLKLANIPLGLLMNFNAPVLKNGLKRFISQPEAIPRSACEARSARA